MLIDTFVSEFDAAETHNIEISAPSPEVYEALWRVDLASSMIVKALLLLRSLPGSIFRPAKWRFPRLRLTLEDLIESGFGKLDEEPGCEVVLGVEGRFWRPAGNLDPFRRKGFEEPVREGRARAVWNFAVKEQGEGMTMLSTETRVVCGDPGSRAKFLFYWRFVGPFSGLIRITMLRSVRAECERKGS